MTIRRSLAVLATLAAPLAPRSTAAQESATAWPAVTSEARPWTRWWWQGSAVDSAELTAALQAYRDAGLGGVELTPIYGVRGAERDFIPYLSPRWTRMLGHTLREAGRLGLGVDMATGTGWPFGGPHVGPAEAARMIEHAEYALNGGERLRDTVRRRQEPLLRFQGTPARRLDASELGERLPADWNLQASPVDQVRFPVPMTLRALVAYSGDGRPIDLTSRVSPAGVLDWTAPPGRWRLHAVFEGWHGKQVERAAPGGEGNVIDHFSRAALQRYLARFDRALAGGAATGLRAFFNDSYEVDDARGQADWTPRMLEEFAARRGYDLRAHLPALFGRDTTDEASRVRSDYRETVSDLMLEEFSRPWQRWARARGAMVRTQSHGSPANILDLYAASDVPETEGDTLFRYKFATSAANVSGARLASAEVATWLREHFVATLADVRAAVDRFLLAGVNHVVYHGTAYSPRGEPWPGQLFYAAVELQPAAPWWSDFAALNAYVTRAQSHLQRGSPDNDVLLYWPIHDRYAEPGEGLLEHFDGTGQRFARSQLRAVAESLQARGYAFDYVSDRQLLAASARAGAIHTAGSRYQAVLVPRTRYMPLETWRQLVALARQGAAVLVHRQLPADVPGLGTLAPRRAAMQRISSALRFTTPAQSALREARVGAGRIVVGDDVSALLARAGVRRERMVDQGLELVRRRETDGHVYFLVNGGRGAVEGWVPLAVAARSAALFDPMTGASGVARTRHASEGPEVYVQVPPGESRIVRTFRRAIAGPPWEYLAPAGPPTTLDAGWSLHFVAGGPDLPRPVPPPALGSWADRGDSALARFGGTGRYRMALDRPATEARKWRLDLGRVCETARVRLDGREVGVVIGPTFDLVLDAAQLSGRNVLEVLVSNSMANRIADLDRRGVEWKKFYNVNFPSRLPENRNARGLFDASGWAPRCSGLVGPVTLTPLRAVNP